MNRLLIFAGTTEGRELAEYYTGKDIQVDICVATDYGEALLRQEPNIHIHAGRKNRQEMAEMMEALSPALVVDATHPYAEEATRTIAAACQDTGTACLRLLREREVTDDSSVIYVSDTQEAVDYLNSVEGNVLLTVGSKELPHYTAVHDYQERLFARVLPLKTVMEDVLPLGFEGKHLICMQGPFSQELNVAMMKAISAKYMVTKDTGSAGGFMEKINAAREAGAKAVVIARPLQEEGLSLKECIRHIDDLFGLPQKKSVTLLGIGTGSQALMTAGAQDICRGAQLIIGSQRALDSLASYDKPTEKGVLCGDIAAIIRKSPYQRIVVALTGDTGFYSGAKKLETELSDCDVTVCPGISSVVYLCSRLRTSWDDAVLCSAHGRNCNVAAKVLRSKKTLILCGGNDGVSSIIDEFLEYGLGHVTVTVGENLSYENETITTGSPAQLKGRQFDSLSVLYVENPSPVCRVPGWADDRFIRGEVPMTKSEVRAVTMAKLSPQPDSICWDVGAGTGSVSLEMASLAENGQVYAIECGDEGCELIEKNKRHLSITNVNVIKGMAPEALENLPAPTHVFLGGTKGNMKAILERILERSPHARIVLNTVTAESFAEAVSWLQTAPVHDVDLLQLGVTRSRKAGRYHLMTAQNPIFLLSFTGGADHE